MGARARRRCGVTVPLHAAEHFYIVTEPIPGLPRHLPVLRDADACTYFKEDAGKLLVGWFEPVAKPWGMNGIPETFSFETLPEDLEHIEPLLEGAIRRVPALATAGIQLFFNGPESFTPDDRYLLGETPEVRRLFVAAGFNSIGIQSAGGAGKVLADWIVDGHPPMDLWDIDIRRAMPFQRNRRYLRDRTVEALGLLYAMHWPFRQPETARGVRRSVLHDRLAARGACFGEAAGWERANWFAPQGVEAKYVYSYGRQNWFEHSAVEHQAVRNAVGLFDQSSFGKFVLEGPDAEAVINTVSANQLSVPVGRIVYTQWLNERGGIEADLTVTREAAHRFLIVSAAATQTRDLAWLRRHIPEAARAVAFDATSAYAVLAVMGPSSRDLLSRLTDADLSNAAFPFGTSQTIDLGYARVRASRITYVGELGWELYIPTEFAQDVFDRIVAQGERCRPAPRRLPRHELAAHGEGLPPLGPRHHRRGHPAAGGPGVRSGLGQEGRLHRPRRPAAPARRRRLAPPRAGRARRQQPAALPQRADLARWRPGRAHHIGHVRPQPRQVPGAGLCNQPQRAGRCGLRGWRSL